LSDAVDMSSACTRHPHKKMLHCRVKRFDSDLSTRFFTAYNSTFINTL
jgi:hypothetical protein